VKAFDVFRWQPSGWPEPHVCKVISHLLPRPRNKDLVEVVMCSTKRTTRERLRCVK
jgi:hypothetical protein